MIILQSEPDKKPRKKETKAPAIKAGVGAKKELVDKVKDLNKFLKQKTAEISALVSSGASPAVVLAKIEQSSKEADALYAANSSAISEAFIGKLSNDNKRKIQSLLEIKLGVDVSAIIDSGKVADKLKEATTENIDKITSIPKSHFDKVSAAVFDNFRGKKFEEGSLANRLRKIGSISDRRAKFIARDQTSNFVSDLNALRQQDAGIKKYVWRNKQDERVVGNPSGKYPKGNRKHLDHWHREGKEFKWSEPPSDGAPGKAINCRCHAEPIINLDSIIKKATIN